MPCFFRETVSLNLILLKSAVRKCVEEFFLATKCNVEDLDPKARVIFPLTTKLPGGLQPPIDGAAEDIKFSIFIQIKFSEKSVRRIQWYLSSNHQSKRPARRPQDHVALK